MGPYLVYYVKITFSGLGNRTPHLGPERVGRNKQYVFGSRVPEPTFRPEALPPARLVSNITHPQCFLRSNTLVRGMVCPGKDAAESISAKR